MGKTLICSILAGVSIAIGAMIFLALKQVSLPFSAIFFTVGLLIILWYGFDLYTGKIGYLASFGQTKTMLWILFGNLIGCCLMFAVSGMPAFGASITIGETAAAIMTTKCGLNLFEAFARAFVCGILIYVAVDQFKTKNNTFAPLIAVPAFILAGAEHCIADACYLFSSLTTGWWMWNVIPFFVVIILGNAVGSIVFHQIKGRL